jgi:UDP-glucose 4-epimerase
LTGGAGYVGSACLRWLLKHGHDAIAFDDLSEGNRGAVPESASRLIVGDLADANALARAMVEHEVEAVMHFAAVASVPESIAEPERYWRVNVIGTKNVLDAMRTAGVKRIVFSSTAATYGFRAEMPLHEDAPQTPYGSTKLACEWLIREYARAYGLGAVFFRYFNASGADPDGSYGEARKHEAHLIPLILQAAVGKRPEVLLYGGDWPTRDGSCVRDYVHTEDLAQAHELAVMSVEPGTVRAYNLGNGAGTTVREVLTACEAAVGRPIPHRVVDRRPGDPAVLVASPEAAIRELGWAPKYPDIRTIVGTAWAWHDSHPDGYTVSRP